MPSYQVNATLTVSGDVTHERLQQLLDAGLHELSDIAGPYGLKVESASAVAESTERRRV